MIDKRTIQENYSTSEKTADRIIKKLGLMHSSNLTISIINYITQIAIASCTNL